jgi:Mg-chelatase subunit ChlD
MIRTFLCATILLLATLYQGIVPAGSLRVGPVYTDKLPTLEIVIERPGAADDSAPALKPQDLVLVEDGRATAKADWLNTFGATGRGLAVVLALDVSASMSGQPLDHLKTALAAFITQAGPQDRVALVTFADDVRVESPFGDSLDNLRYAINSLAPRGRSTELYKGIFKALSLFDGPHLPARRRLIVFSDGQDSGSAYTLDDAINRANQQSVPVDAVGLTRGDPRYLSALERLADMTGGYYAQANSEDQLEALFHQGIARLQATPVASFTVQRLSADGQPHDVGVRAGAGGQFQEGATRLVFPLVEAPPPAKPDRLVPLWVWLAGGAVVLVLLLIPVMVVRRRRHAAMEESAGAPAAPPAQESKPFPPPSEKEGPALPEKAPPRGAGAARGAPAKEEGGAAAGSQPARRKTQFRTEFAPPAAGRPSAVLVAQEGPNKGQSFPIEASPFWIGAEEKSDLCVAGDARLSGFHACIQFHEGSLLLRDNRSTNGTYINGERLNEAPRPLNPGDRIRLGGSVFIVAARMPGAQDSRV